MSRLAVLPLRSLASDGADQHIGLGIADTIIAAVSRADTLTVRPTSAVRRYVGTHNTLTAARDLEVDAVLEGSWFREGDRLRVSVNLVRTEDARSLWTDAIDVRAGDLFAIQDQLAGPMAAKLRAVLTSAPRRHRRGTTSAVAYELYLKGKFYFGERGYTFQPGDRANSDTATRLFEQAVAADPDFAEAHAMLGFAHAWTAVFIEENAALIERAEAETRIAARLDDQLGQVHLNRGFILFSWYRGWRLAEALQENRRALELDPGLSDIELGALFFHAGLYEQWERWTLNSIAIDPTNQTLKTVFIAEHFLAERPDDGLAMQRRLLGPRDPDARYFLGKHMAREAAPLVEAAVAKTPADRWVMVAQTYALGGRSADAIHWLTETVDNGFPNYPLLASDPALNRIRSAPEFTSLLIRVQKEFEVLRDAARM